MWCILLPVVQHVYSQVIYTYICFMENVLKFTFSMAKVVNSLTDAERVYMCVFMLVCMPVLSHM